MDPMILAIASALGTGMATGAGERAGTALATLIGRVRQRLTGAQQSTEETAAALHEEFVRDPAFAEEIRALWQQVNQGNSFTGTAKNVLQIQESNGPITLT
ncbi:hypothetical protein HII36_09795 [Nonomuraea sp. NN258]|uniref:hypothetical protein n=1 Tax=Nonomuraea antri TaxID=2730852 RepID=UPI001569E14B|nr:hypothetical protein [Nonomuraea antri]NRQ32128.1 hypothetical protein [Nonomuraea antri]